MTNEPDAPYAPTRRWTPAWIVAAVALLLVLLVAVGTQVLAAGSPAPEARSGQTIEQGGDYDGSSVDVELPFATMGLTIGEPRATLLDDPDGTVLRPPPDGSFVPLTWGFDDDASRLRPIPVAGPGVDIADVELAVVVDGERYPVRVDGARTIGIAPRGGALLLGDSTVQVAVPGDPEVFDVVVTYDGQEQVVTYGRGEAVVTDEGAFAPYRDLPQTEREVKVPAQLPDGFRVRSGGGRGGLTVHWVARLPYIAGLGWAPDGRAWFVVTLTRAPLYGVVADTPRGVAEYDADMSVGEWPRATTFALDGETPVVPAIDVNEVAGPLTFQDVDGPRMLVFDVARTADPAALEIVARPASGTPYFVDPNESVAPSRPTVPVHWRVRLPEVP